MVRQCRNITTQKCADTQNFMLPKLARQGENRQHFALSATCRHISSLVGIRPTQKSEDQSHQLVLIQFIQIEQVPSSASCSFPKREKEEYNMAEPSSSLPSWRDSENHFLSSHCVHRDNDGASSSFPFLRCGVSSSSLPPL